MEDSKESLYTKEEKLNDYLDFSRKNSIFDEKNKNALKKIMVCNEFNQFASSACSTNITPHSRNNKSEFFDRSFCKNE